MHQLRLSLLATTLIALSASGALAQVQPGLGRPTAGIFGGYTIPRGDFGDEAANGWHVGALLKMRLYGALDGRIDGAYTKLAKKDIEFADAVVSANPSVKFGTAALLLNLGPDSAAYPGDNSVSPHIIAGIGAYNLDYDYSCAGVGCVGFTSPAAKTHLGVNVGAGATVPLGGIRAFVEGRYHRIMRDEAENNGSFLNNGSASMFLLSVGFKIR